ncbi:MAG: lipoprotein-releasing system permease protein, partial [Candidatus Binatia bacterium]
MGWELMVGLRYLRSRRNEAFVSVITFIATLGVLLGVMVLTITMSVMTGFEEDLRARILGLHAHLRVTKGIGTGVIDNPVEIADLVAGQDEVLDAAPVIQTQLLISSGEQLFGVFGRAIDPTRPTSLAGIMRYVVEGDPKVLGQRMDYEGTPLPTAMIGRELGRKLGIGRGDVLRLMAPRMGASPLGALPRSRRFVVGALYDSGMVEYDTALVYLGLEDARVLLDTGPIATGIEVRIPDPYDAPDVASMLSERIGPPFVVESWTEAHRNIFEALQLEKTAYFLILLLIILVAAFTIVSSLYMVVMEKRRDIAVLKTMGATDRSIARVFVAKGVLIGGVGTGLGVLLGYLGCLALGRWELIPLPEGVFYVKTLPVRMIPANFALVAAASMIICFGACLFPAWKASRIVPVEV